MNVRGKLFDKRYLTHEGTRITHKKYLHGITPDEEIKTPVTDTTDPTLDAARTWLTKRYGYCSE